MDFSIEDGATDATLSRAIMLYETKEQWGSSSKTVLATIHDVCDCGTVARPDLQILPGTPITKDALLAAVMSMASRYTINTEIFPEYLLGCSPKHLLWWRPAGESRVFFRNQELGHRSSIVPHPALLFLVVDQTWYVFAMKDSKRPTSDTELFHSPYFNIYDDAHICIGTAQIPDRLTPSSISGYETAFFESEFTAPNGRIKKIDHPTGDYAFWKEMLDGQYKTFPVEKLVPFKNTLADLLKGLARLGENNG